MQMVDTTGRNRRKRKSYKTRVRDEYDLMSAEDQEAKSSRNDEDHDLDHTPHERHPTIVVSPTSPNPTASQLHHSRRHAEPRSRIHRRERKPHHCAAHERDRRRYKPHHERDKRNEPHGRAFTRRVLAHLAPRPPRQRQTRERRVGETRRPCRPCCRARAAPGCTGFCHARIGLPAEQRPGEEEVEGREGCDGPERAEEEDEGPVECKPPDGWRMEVVSAKSGARGWGE